MMGLTSSWARKDFDAWHEKNKERLSFHTKESALFIAWKEAVASILHKIGETMTDDQKKALEVLNAVDCQMADAGEKTCGGPWCKAREAVLAAFAEPEIEFEVKLGANESE